MRYPVNIVFNGLIPLFAERPSHPSVPLGDPPASAHSEGQGRPSAGACALPLTAASTLAGWRRRGDRTVSRYAALALAGVLSVFAWPALALAQPEAVERSAVADPHAAHIAEASRRFGIPEHWIRAVMHAESAGDVRAISSAGAMGLMQVMPATWAELRVRHRFGSDPFNARDNILVGTAYLREMLDLYGNIGAMLAAYNAGPGRYDEYRTTGRALPAETRAYVAALAPVLGSDPRREALPTPADWRDAPLFVTRAASSHAAGSVQIGGQSSDDRLTPPTRTDGATASLSGSLFVERSGTERSP